MRLRNVARLSGSLLGVFLALSLLSATAFAGDDDSYSLWNYGVALSYMKLEHYPGSKDFSWLWVPLPVVEYRGKSSRLDENDGARAYLLKWDTWGLDLSGTVLPGQNYASDEAREGMPELPWMFELGPQLVKYLSDHFQLRLGIFPAVSTQFQSLHFNGEYYDARLVFLNETRISFPVKALRSDYIALSLQGASKDFMATYYEVPEAYATPTRPVYHAKTGIVCNELGVYEAFTSGFTSLYAGAYYDNYSVARNHDSPLLKADHNVTFFIAMGYTFSRSAKKSVDIDETEGLINRLYDKEK